MNIPAAIVLTGLVVQGCATLPKPREIENVWAMEGTYDDAWTAVVQTFAELNLTILTIEKDSGIIATDWISFLAYPDVCDCGGAGISTLVDRTGKFNAFLKRTATGVDLRVNATFDGQFQFSNTKTNRLCVSTGVLEKRIHESVAEKLAHP